MSKSILVIIFVLLCAAFVFAGELTSKEAVNYFSEGVKLQESGNFIAAESFYQKVLLVDPGNPGWKKAILNNRAVIFAQQGFPDDAEDLLIKSLRVDPDYLPAKLNLGFIYEQRRSELESIKYWLKVLNIDLEAAKPKGYVLGEAESKEKK